jgi:hypothetical protein
MEQRLSDFIGGPAPGVVGVHPRKLFPWPGASQLGVSPTPDRFVSYI